MAKKQNKIIYPKYACNVPTLYGESCAIYDNLFLYPKKVILSSATIPTTLKRKLIKKAKLHKYEVVPQIKITQIPFTYDVTMLKMESNLSEASICKILNSINLAQTEIFLVESSHGEAYNMFKTLSNNVNLIGKIAFFEQGDYIKAEDTLTKKVKEKNTNTPITLTYIRSAICKGDDMPDINLVIVDGSSFLPNIALNFEEASSEIEQKALQAEELTKNLTQVIGRVFRSNEKREKFTVKDPRKIVILIHSLPQIIQNFEPDMSIIHNYQEFLNEQIEGVINNKQTRCECIIKTINQALSGEQIIDKEKEQRDYAFQKAQELGLSELGRKHRRDCYDLLTEEQRKILREQKRQKE